MKKKQRNKKWRAVRGRVLSLAFLVSAAMAGTGNFAYADKLSDAAKGAATGLQTTVAGATKWIVMGILVVIGVVFLVGSNRKKEEAKETIIERIIGVACILFAASFATIIFGWFS